jgi:hypothetical protein
LSVSLKLKQRRGDSKSRIERTVFRPEKRISTQCKNGGNLKRKEKPLVRMIWVPKIDRKSEQLSNEGFILTDTFRNKATSHYPNSR